MNLQWYNFCSEVQCKYFFKVSFELLNQLPHSKLTTFQGRQHGKCERKPSLGSHRFFRIQPRVGTWLFQQERRWSQSGQAASSSISSLACSLPSRNVLTNSASGSSRKAFTCSLIRARDLRRRRRSKRRHYQTIQKYAITKQGQKASLQRKTTSTL